MNFGEGIKRALQVTAREILDEYAPDSLTHNDIREIHEAFLQAGIKPSEEHSEIVCSAGFDTYQLRSRFDGAFAPSEKTANETGNQSLLNELLEVLNSEKLLDFFQAEEPKLMEMLELFKPDELVMLLESREIDQEMANDLKVAGQKILKAFDIAGDVVDNPSRCMLLREMLEVFEVMKMLSLEKLDKTMLMELRSALSLG